MRKVAFITVPLVIVVGLVFCVNSVFGAELFPSRQEGKWGFVDKDGSYVIKPQFDQVGRFSEGLAFVRRGQKYGYINRQGEVEIPLQFECSSPGNHFYGFGATYCRGKDARRMTRNIPFNPELAWMLMAKFYTGEGLQDFSDERAAFYRDGKWGFINRQGAVVIEPQYDFVGSFANQRAPVLQGEKWGVIDSRGRSIVQPKYPFVSNYSNGLALYIRGSGNSKARGSRYRRRKVNWGYLDRSGEPVRKSRSGQQTQSAMVSRAKSTIATIRTAYVQCKMADDCNHQGDMDESWSQFLPRRTWDDDRGRKYDLKRENGNLIITVEDIGGQWEDSRGNKGTGMKYNQNTGRFIAFNPRRSSHDEEPEEDSIGESQAALSEAIYGD